MRRGVNRRGGGAAAALLVLLTACGAAERPAARVFLSIGTGGTGGIYYPLGGALASRLSVADPHRRYTAEVTGGAVENVNRVREGQIDLGFALAITAYEAYQGGLDYASPVRDLRIVAPLYPNLTHVLVPGRSPARGLEDLAGRRVSVGAPGSGTEQLARQLLEAHGVSYGDITPRFLSFSESAAALRDGAIDAAILSVGYPAAAALEATATGGARLLPIPLHRARALEERHPYHTPGTLPAGAYPGLDRELPTVAMMNWIVARESLEDDVVERLLDILEDQRAELAQVHEMARQIDLDALRQAPIPLHPAAERWLARRRGPPDGP